nr:MAG: hypothetical protein [uncultured archaeon]
MPAKVKNIKKPKNIFEQVLEYDKISGLLFPVQWKYPSLKRRRNYIAIIIGLNPTIERYVFERIFCEPKIFEIDNDEKRETKIGFDKFAFRDDLILEEKYSYKEKKTFISKVNYWEITVLDDGIYGVKINKTQIKDKLGLQQKDICEKFREIMDNYGEAFTLYSMESILKRREALLKNKSYSILDRNLY